MMVSRRRDLLPGTRRKLMRESDRSSMSVEASTDALLFRLNKGKYARREWGHDRGGLISAFTHHFNFIRNLSKSLQKHYKYDEFLFFFFLILIPFFASFDFDVVVCIAAVGSAAFLIGSVSPGALLWSLARGSLRSTGNRAYG